MALSYVQANTLFLSGSGVIVGATTISLTSFADIYGNVLTMASFGSKGYGTLEPDTTNEEAYTFTGVTANANGTYTLTGVASALAQTPYTETPGLVRQHSGGTKVVITDNVAFWNTFANKQNNETITGTWTFNTAPSSLSATPASTSALGNVKLTTTPFTSLGTATITIASPAVVTLASHGLIAGDSVQFTTTGALPTGIVAGTNYFVISTGLTTNSFEISLTVGGTAVVTTGTQSGTQTLIRTTPFAVGNEDTRLPTAAEALGLANAPTTPSSTNPYYTKTDVFAANINRTYVTSSNNFTVPANVTKLFVQVQAPGGAAGTGAGGGGGAGGYTEGFLTVTPAQVIAYTIGATTSMSTLSATSGSVGANNSNTSSGSSAAGGAGGTGSGGSLNVVGAPGAPGTFANSGGLTAPGVGGMGIIQPWGNGAGANQLIGTGGIIISY